MLWAIISNINHKTGNSSELIVLYSRDLRVIAQL